MIVAALALVGFGFGLAYFATLARVVDLYLRGARWLRAACLHLARVVAAVVVFALAARAGAAPLLAAFGGFVAARAVVVRMSRGRP